MTRIVRPLIKAINLERKSSLDIMPEGCHSYHARTARIEKLPRSGFVLLAVLTLFWGSTFPAMKIALSEISPWTFRTLCLIFGGLGLLTLVKISGLSLAIHSGEFRPLLLVSLLNTTGWYICSAYGVVYMPAGRAVIIAFSMPLWAVILGNFVLGERLTFRLIVGLGLGITGLIILIGPELKTVGSAPLGSMFMLIAAVSWAAGTVAVKYFHWTMPTTLLAGWQLIIGGIPIIIGAVIFEPISVLLTLSWQTSLVMVYFIALPIIFCQWAWYKLIALFPASVASIGTLAVPFVGVFSSTLILGEAVGIRELAALILVVTALAIVMIGPEETCGWLK
jgi:drug/metabolite transporter (DMT)-like permease